MMSFLKLYEALSNVSKSTLVWFKGAEMSICTDTYTHTFQNEHWLRSMLSKGSAHIYPIPYARIQGCVGKTAFI